GEVAVELGDRSLLVGRQPEGQQTAVAGDQVARLAERRGDLVLALAVPSRQAELEQEQLVEREPPAAALGVVERARPVESVERVRAAGKALRLAQPGRQRIDDVADQRQRTVGERPPPRRRDLLPGRIDRREVAGRGGAVEVVRTDRELVAAQLATQSDACPRPQLLREPVL